MRTSLPANDDLQGESHKNTNKGLGTKPPTYSTLTSIEMLLLFLGGAVCGFCWQHTIKWGVMLWEYICFLIG